MNNILEAISITSGILGEIWECGTFRGDNSLRIKNILDENKDNRIIRMFDTFTGQPFSGPFDTHQQGSMNETNFNIVNDKFKDKSNIFIESGIMPFTFASFEDVKLSLTNIDVDNYDSVKDCLEFVYPRTSIGGFIFFDDYGCPACPGARKAVNEFLLNRKEILSGQAPAYIMKL